MCNECYRTSFVIVKRTPPLGAGVEVDASVVEVVTAGEDAEDNEKPRELGFHL